MSQLWPMTRGYAMSYESTSISMTLTLTLTMTLLYSTGLYPLKL